MRLLVIVLLLSTVAHADRGPWYSRSAAHAALWTRFAKDDPKRAVELTRGPLRHDVPACMKPGVARSGAQKLAFVKCLGDALKKVDPVWILTPTTKLATDAQKTFAKQFGRYTAFVVTTHARGNIVLALGRPAGKRDPLPVLGVLVDDANAD
jgi:hypothetical protein